VAYVSFHFVLLRCYFVLHGLRVSISMWLSFKFMHYRMYTNRCFCSAEDRLNSTDVLCGWLCGLFDGLEKDVNMAVGAWKSRAVTHKVTI
jgi:hypothetical protein